MTKFPRDPIIRGSFFKINKQYSKLRKKKKKEFRQSVLDRLDALESENPKEYWSLLNSLKDEKKANKETDIEGEVWYKYFSDLSSISPSFDNKVKAMKEKIQILETEPSCFNQLDFKISSTELQKALKQLKSGKSPGLDNISNEMLKASQSYMSPCYLKLFNSVFRSGHYPKSWSESFIRPLYKSEDPKKPENYRGIAINNSIGKLFNIILNNRLDKFFLDNNTIHPTQIGFSRKSRTSDHIFVLKSVIDKYLNRGGKKLFTCFVDFRKAFDRVIHAGIMLKMLEGSINGFFYRILKNMYKNDRLCVRVDNKITDFFSSNVGVRQGDVLSPNLFKFFINDLPQTIEDTCECIKLNNNTVPCLLYADDLVLFSDTKQGLQKQLNTLYGYCNDWCIDINVKKTKIIIFNKTGRLISEEFNIGSNKIECIKSYKYLGIIFNNTGKFNEAKKNLYDKGLKASFKLYKSIKSASPSLKTLLHIFDHTIKPIVLYGSEIWGMINITQKRKGMNLYDIYKEWEPEILNLKFCKYILGVTKNCTHLGVISELGRFPLYINIIVQMFMYWHRLENNPTKLLNDAYAENKTIQNQAWFASIKFFAEKLNFDLEKCKKMGKNMFKQKIKKCLKVNFLTLWKSIRETQKQSDHSKLSTYFIFKQHFSFETYLTIKDKEKRSTLARFRLSNHRLRIETGRYEKKRDEKGKLITLPRSERICQFCKLNRVEDEIHFLFNCTKYSKERETFVNNLFTKHIQLSNLSQENLFLWCMTNESSHFNIELINLISLFYTLRIEFVS